MKTPATAKILCVVALFCAAASYSNANLVANPGFETGDFTGWTVNDPSMFTGVGSNPTFAQEGNHYAYLGANPDVGSLSQNLSTVVGASYNLSFWLANDFTAGLDPTNSFEVFWNGVSILTLTNAPVFDYTQFNFTNLVATGASTTLEFRYRHGNDFFRLDDVSVQVPESLSTAWLACPAVLLFGFLHFSRRKTGRNAAQA